jgi:hypothetical protein
MARKSPAEVAQLLGPPDTSVGVQTGQHPTYTYRGGTVQVVYVAGRANWIKIYGLKHLEFSREALSKLGLSPRKPTYTNPGRVLSWSNLPNLREVSLYRDDQSGVSSLLVCVETTSDPANRPERPSRAWTSLRALLSA